jgi:ribosomal 50S subunit-associated protein YjgA (DUF615 family)
MTAAICPTPLKKTEKRRAKLLGEGDSALDTGQRRFREKE